MPEFAYSSWQPFAVISATTTAAKIDANTAATSCRAMMITLVGGADQGCWIGDSSIAADGSGGAHYLTWLSAGGSVTIPVGSTQFVKNSDPSAPSTAGTTPYVVMFTGSAGAKVIVSILK